MELNDTHKDLWEDVWTPLRRWPRCTDVTVFIDTARLDEPMVAAEVLALPFAGMSFDARQRITGLTLELSGPFDVKAYEDNDVPVPAAAIASTLLSLPRLQKVELTDGMSDDRLQQQILYDALASLPHLEELTLPYCSALERLGLLSDSRNLRRLRLTMAWGSLDEDILRGIQRLRQLEYLSLELDYGSGGLLRSLLSSYLPPALRLLEVPAFCDYEAMAFGLRDGRITCMEVRGPSVMRLDHLARLAARVLLPSGTVGQQLERIALRGVVVPRAGGEPPGRGDWDDSDGDAEAPAGRTAEAEVEQLRALLQRAARLEVDAACVREAATPGSVLECLDLLGDGVKELQLLVPNIGNICLRLSGNPGLLGVGEQPEQRRGEGQSRAPSLPPPPPSQLSLCDMALERMTAPAGGAGCSSSSTAAAAAAVRSAGGREAVDTGGTAAESSMYTGAPPDGAKPRLMLLLRGRLLAGLAWSPDALKAWLGSVTERAKASLAAPEAAQPHAPPAEGNAAQRAPIQACLSISCSDALLVSCRDVAAVQAVEAAVRAAAAAASGPAVAEEAPLLLVLPVPGGTPPYTTGCIAIQTVVGQALRQAAWCVWSGEGSTAGWSSRARLEWLLEQHELLSKSLKFVFM